jgi:hypothetical protein
MREFPQKWKEPIITPTYEKGGEIGCINWRRISLLPTTYPIFSNIPLSCLTAYVEEITGIHQGGFRRN